MASTNIKGEFLPIILVDLNKSWETILELGTPMSFKPRSVIFQREYPASAGMYLVRRGLVKLSHVSLTGSEKTHFYLGRNSLFHEAPMMYETHDHAFTCIEPTEIVFFEKKLITPDFVRQYPELTLNMLESFSIKASVLYANSRREHSFSVFVRVCRVLYSMQLYQQDRGVVVPRLTQQELATFLGIHRSSLHKALSRLCGEGVIGTYRKKELPIYDAGTLLKYALE
jgi:CRP-like cAMP-binding protein